jgi:hypothetical protein
LKFSSKISFNLIIFLSSKAFFNTSSEIFFSSSIICSKLAQVAGLSEITQQYSGILQAKL